MSNDNKTATVSLHPSHPDFVASEQARDNFIDAYANMLSALVNKRNQDKGQIPDDSVSQDELIQTEIQFDTAYEDLQTSFANAHRNVPQEQKNMYENQKKLILMLTDNNSDPGVS